MPTVADVSLIERTLLAVRHSRPALASIAVGAVVLAGCTADPQPTPSPTQTSATELVAEVTTPRTTTVVATDDAVRTAVAASREVYAQAPLVVLAEDDPAALATAASVAVAAGTPLLLDDGGAGRLTAEFDRLGTSHVLTVGEVSAPEGIEAAAVPEDLGRLSAVGIDLGERQTVEESELVEQVAALDRPETVVLDLGDTPSATETEKSSTTLSLPGWSSTSAPSGSAEADLWTDGTTVATPSSAPSRTTLLIDPTDDLDPSMLIPALASARAAGVPVIEMPGGDPRASTETVQALADIDTALAVGNSFESTDRLTTRLQTVATGVELPGGGQLMFPEGPALTGKKYVALYGTPGTPALGVLGEQDVPATIARAEETARGYRALTDDHVVPTLEIIATIASAGPEADGSYSRGRSVDELRPLIEAAGDAGMAVVIDLQPGRTDFLTQAQRYAELLEYPHVGLALDPEWRLAPDQVHLRQIGSVSADEVNQVSDWLAQFVRDRDLPQKMFLLHQFSLRMITDRERLNVDHDELATVIHADGQGSQPAKAGTWTTLHQGAPPVHWGWKNFYDEDQPMLTPEQTYQVQPTPDLVTYQ